MTVIKSLDDNTLQAICDVIGDTGTGLTGSEMGRSLTRQNISDIEPLITKRHRDRKSTRLNSSHLKLSRMPSSA